MATFAVGDIHGRADKLKAVLEKSGFRRETDALIVLGDVVDRGKNVRECVDELLGIPRRVFVLGNHDARFMQWMKDGGLRLYWRLIGGHASVRSYGKPEDVPSAHRDFFGSAVPYYEEDGLLFVHGGFDPARKIEHHSRQQLTGEGTIGAYARALIRFARKQPIPNFSHVFVGHTPTQWVSFRHSHPLTFHNLTMLDTGCGFPTGKLTLMNIRTRQYWQA